MLTLQHASRHMILFSAFCMDTLVICDVYLMVEIYVLYTTARTILKQNRYFTMVSTHAVILGILPYANQ